MITVTVQYKKNNDGEFFEAFFEKYGKTYSYSVSYKLDNAEENEYRDFYICDFQKDALNGLLEQEFGSTINLDFRNSPKHWHYDPYDDNSVASIDPDDLETPSIFNITNKDFHTVENHPWEPWATAPKDGTVIDALFLIDGQKVRVPKVKYIENGSNSGFAFLPVEKSKSAIPSKFEYGHIVRIWPDMLKNAIYWKKVDDDPFYHPWLE